MKRQHSKDQLRIMTAVAVFSALAYISVPIFRIPNVGGFLTFDFKDGIIIVASMLIGPGAAVFMSILVPFLEMVTISSTFLYGFAMNAISSLAISLTASLIYKKKKTLSGAVLGLCCGVVAVTLVMIPANLLLTPFYLMSTFCPTYGVAFDTLVGFLPLIIPFNLIKGITNASFAFMLYKPLSLALKRTGMLGINTSGMQKKDETAGEKKKRVAKTVLISTASALVVILAVVVIMLAWKPENGIAFFDFGIFKNIKSLGKNISGIFS